METLRHFGRYYVASFLADVAHPHWSTSRSVLGVRRPTDHPRRTPSSMRRLLRLLKRALTPSEDLTSRTITGGLWTAFTNSSGRILQTVALLVLARLLSPTDFGLFGIATLTLTTLSRFSRLGFDTALVQRLEENVDAFLDTVFTLRILRGAVVAVIAFFAAPFVAAFFSEPRATLLIQVIVLSTLCKSFSNPGTIYFQKDLEFHKQFVLSFSNNSVRAVVSIGYALVTPTVWALVAGAIAGNFTRMIISYAVHDYRPRPGFDRGRAAELVDYSKWVYGSSVVSFFYSEGDDIFVGRVLGSESLGVYQLAYQLANAPATEIAHTVSRVAMPAYSKVQDDTADLREGFHRVLRLSSLVSLPVGVGIAVVAPVFVPTFLGSGWEAMVLPMQVLALFGVLRSIRTSASPLFRAVGRPDLTAKIHAIRLGVMVVTILPLTAAFGLVGTALSVLLTSAVGIPVATALVMRIVDDDLRSLSAIIWFPALGTLLMGGCAVVVRQFVGEFAGGLTTFVVTVLAGVIVYVLFLVAAEWRFDVGLEQFFNHFKGIF